MTTVLVVDDDPMIAALPPQNEEWKEANGY